MHKNVRVRFAPSPTGGLHLGGMRTVLYNYLFAKQHGGEFVVRIEDTDQSRYVEGAEKYIFDCLKWAGLNPDESPEKPGQYGPYRQSERKSLYRKYAEELVEKGHAYYAFDTPEDLDRMRQEFKTSASDAVQYDHTIRMKMRNSLTLSEDEVKTRLQSGAKHVIRIKMNPGETVRLMDLIREEVIFDTSVVDDKVLLKADGMPTYHLAVVVDDYMMKISHAFRGEEWLPSAPVHILLWRYLFGEENMPQWAHLPLIMGPNGKLSKRDGLKYGFPVFAMNWKDPATSEMTEGFRERGFLPEAFVNMLAMLGWNDGTEQEIFSIDELIQKFSIDRVHKSGAKFDYEKAKWFNHEWIKRTTVEKFEKIIEESKELRGVKELGNVYKIIELVKDRCTLLTDFEEQSRFFFHAPQQYDLDAVKSKWSAGKADFFQSFISELDATPNWDAAFIEDAFKRIALEKGIKAGELQLPFRIMLVGGKFGPPVFHITELLGKEETISRIRAFLKLI